METVRLMLFLGLAMVLMLLYQAWQEDYGQPPAPTPVAATDQAAPEAPPGDIPDAPAPQVSPAAKATPGAGAASAESVPGAPVAASGPRVRVRTDVLDVEISLQGGDLRRVALPTYPVSVEEPDVPFQLMDDQVAEVFFSQSGLLSDGPAPNHHDPYASTQNEFVLAEGSDELKVNLVWQSEEGLRVTKEYTFRRGDFVVDQTFRIENNTPQDWSGRVYRQLQRSEPAETSRFLYTYTGGVVSRPDKLYDKVSFDDMRDEPVNMDVEGGWVAMIQHYFIGAIVPGSEQVNRFYSKALSGNRYVVGAMSQGLSVPAGDTQSFTTRYFIGPKIQDRLQATAPGLELTVDYGWLTVLAKPLFWLLKYIYGWVGNWGWAIIFVTIIIKAAFYKLSETSYRNMANMKKLTPRLQALKERFGGDKQKLNQAMMDLYKREKINPLGGCLPILIQIPVFIALYWVLLESVELRQASFILWLDDLSLADPYYVLPLIMGATMLLQQKLNPAPLDPVQQKVMMALPIVFTVFFIFFPAGLVLYWVVNNILSIAQQWWITRRIQATA